MTTLTLPASRKLHSDSSTPAPINEPTFDPTPNTSPRPVPMKDPLPKPSPGPISEPQTNPHPDPIIAQAKRDIDAGQVDTDMRATPGLNAALRAKLVPGPAGKNRTSGG